MTSEDHTRGPVPCDQVGMFVDGELDETQAETFRQHLVHCARCQAEMHALMQLGGLAEEAGRTDARSEARPGAATAVLSPPRFRYRTARLAAVGGLALAAAVIGVVAVKQRGRSTADVPTLLASLEVRSVSGWPSGLGVSTYRGYDTVRGVTPPPSTSTSNALSSAELRAEQAEDWRAAGTLALLRRDFARADGFLARLPQRADVLADRGLVRLEQGTCDDALEYLDRALRQDPTYGPAQFNRGLCLRRLDLAAAAASTFKTLASANLGGWSGEARAQADDLGRGLRKNDDLEQTLLAASQKLVDRQEAFPSDLAVRFPGRARARFYRAMALAPGLKELRALLPIAQNLDAEFGTTVLEARTRTAIAAAKPERARISQDLRGFYAAYPEGPRVDALLQKAQRAGQDDQALQLYNDFKETTTSRERTRLNRAANDPYAQVLLAAATAYQFRGAGRVLEAETALRDAVPECKDESLAVACWYLDIQRVEVELALSRFDSAARIALSSARRMRALGLRDGERNARLQAAEVLLAAGKIAGARGSFEDIGLREPDACQVTIFRAERLAAGYVRRGDLAGAIQALANLPSCPLFDMQMHPDRLALRLDLAVLESKPAGLADVIRIAAGYVADPQTTPEDRALAQVVSARAAVELDRPGAISQLAASLRQLDPFLSQVEPRQARARGWATLALAELRQGRAREALTALSSQLGLGAPGPCTLGLVVDGARRGWAAVDASGTTSNHYDREGAESAPPPSIWRSCPAVAVLSSGWERVELALPTEVAWSVRLAEPSAPGASEGERLLVRDVRPPPELKLPPLGLQTVRTSAEWSLLEGGEATPEHVLRALKRASYAEFEVHGIIDADVPDGALLVLSEDADRRYALSARDLEGTTLPARPVVMLGACRAAAASAVRDESWALPKAFLGAGARGVFASRVELPDAEVGPFFASLRERMERGTAPALALRDEKLAWLSKGRMWVRDVLLFD